MIVDPLATFCPQGHSLVGDCSKRFDPSGTHHCYACELLARRKFLDDELLRLGVVA